MDEVKRPSLVERFKRLFRDYPPMIQEKPMTPVVLINDNKQETVLCLNAERTEDGTSTLHTTQISPTDTFITAIIMTASEVA